ncbi:hypothetical protein ABT093_24185 [Kitasatospora sp. NPDC002551]|uniref:hypothetical protein n=1 Tax=Kitasatospora sp. NPDC002551 TaxID=3154539 RepID=UPI00332BF5C0
MAQQETSNTVTDSTVNGIAVQIGTASGPISIGDGPQHNDLRTVTTVVVDGRSVSSIPLDLL